MKPRKKTKLHPRYPVAPRSRHPHPNPREAIHHEAAVPAKSARQIAKLKWFVLGNGAQPQPRLCTNTRCSMFRRVYKLVAPGTMISGPATKAILVVSLIMRSKKSNKLRTTPLARLNVDFLR
jgi:hypothetical protein